MTYRIGASLIPPIGGIVIGIDYKYQHVASPELNYPMTKGFGLNNPASNRVWRPANLNMDPEAKTAGVFPFFVCKTGSESRINVLEIPGDLTEIKGYCLQHGIELPRFFMAVWSIVFSQFAEKDHLYFGFEDSTSDCRSKTCAGLDIIAATVHPHTEIKSLLRGESLGPKILSPAEMLPTCNTALKIVQYDRQVDPEDWLESTIFEHLVSFAFRH